MSTIKIKLVKRPTIRAKVLPRFSASVEVSEFLTLTKANGIYTFGVDYTQISNTPISDASTAYVVVYDATSETYKIETVATLLQLAPTVDQHITAPGPATVGNTTGIVRVDQTVGSSITINLPAASNKTCPVLIADWKGDAGTNNITIVPNGSEKIQGRSSWTIAADNGSVFLRPLTGVGYVI